METILSDGVSEDDYRAADFETLTELFAARVSPEHVAFISSFTNYLEIGDYLFVHAGIRPGVPLEDQSPSDLRWIREAFLSHSGDHGRCVVHGHSIREEAESRGNRIGIDTGAYASDRLSAVGLEDDRRWFLSTLDA
jgi:serine/threonine protein phosphatase 1